MPESHTPHNYTRINKDLTVTCLNCGKSTTAKALKNELLGKDFSKELFAQ